jgi:hypothetical protein
MLRLQLMRLDIQACSRVIQRSVGGWAEQMILAGSAVSQVMQDWRTGGSPKDTCGEQLPQQHCCRGCRVASGPLLHGCPIEGSAHFWGRAALRQGSSKWAAEGIQSGEQLGGMVGKWATESISV